MKDGMVRKSLYGTAEKLDLWGFGSFGMPRIELDGDRHMTIEPHDGILEYGPERIQVMASEMEITVEGMGLEIAAMEKGSLEIKGQIASVGFAR